MTWIVVTLLIMALGNAYLSLLILHGLFRNAQDIEEIKRIVKYQFK